MDEKDKLRIQLMEKEIESQRAGLRLMDGSLHNLAFAYIGAFMLCVPALLTREGDASTVSQTTQAVIGFIICTLLYMGGFYALMLVRSRNNCVAHIAFLQRQINEILKRNYERNGEILFSYSFEISDFYRGQGHGVVWFLSYCIALMLIVIAALWLIVKNAYVYPFLTAISILELIATVSFYAYYFTVSGSRNNLRHIDKEYQSWIDAGKQYSWMDDDK